MMDTPPPAETPAQKDIRLNKDMAAFSYIWIMSVIIYFARRDSPFVQYHSRQAMVLFFVSLPLAIIPVIGNLLILFPIAGMLYGFFTAAQGQYSSIPIITPLAKGDMSIADAIKVIEDAVKQFLNALRKSPQDKKNGTSTTPDSPPPSSSSAS